MATLNVPPPGVPDSAIEAPVQPETLLAVGVAGTGFAVTVNEEEAPVQFALLPKTVTAPVTPDDGKAITQVVVPCPEDIAAPAGTLHV